MKDSENASTKGIVMMRQVTLTLDCLFRAYDTGPGLQSHTAWALRRLFSDYFNPDGFLRRDNAIENLGALANDLDVLTRGRKTTTGPCEGSKR